MKTWLLLMMMSRFVRGFKVLVLSSPFIIPVWFYMNFAIC